MDVSQFPASSAALLTSSNAPLCPDRGEGQLTIVIMMCCIIHQVPDSEEETVLISAQTGLQTGQIISYHLLNLIIILSSSYHHLITY